MDSLATIFVIVALVAGLAIGWLARGRSVAPLLAERADLAGKLIQGQAGVTACLFDPFALLASAFSR